MFTGLVDDVGTIERVASTAVGRELRITCRYNDLAEGESVAVNGACLTVRDHEPGAFTVAAVETTLDVTAIGEWKAGQRVNLERAMRVSDRFGGHIVQGHVDGVARVTRAETDGDARLIDLALPPGLSELMVDRGSVTVDGVSLTVVGLPGSDAVSLSIIEHTLRNTTLGMLKVGDRVHVEADVIAKHVRRLVRGTTITI
jgi:riboflavin synthase